MLLTSVRDLKAQISEGLASSSRVSSLSLLEFRAFASRRQPKITKSPEIALGISRGKTKNDFNLAVRLSPMSSGQSQAYNEVFTELAKGEVDIRHIGYVRPFARPPLLRRRPLTIGSSVAHINVTAGTLGGFFKHSQDEVTVILSNNHVLADTNAANIHDNILQPSPLDGGNIKNDKVATLLNSIPLNPNSPNFIDAAIAKIDFNIDINPSFIAQGLSFIGPKIDGFLPEDKVIKVGRTTGLTRGTVTAIEVDNVSVDYPSLGILRFDNQIEIEGEDANPFSRGGDSGSLIFDTDGYAGALLFAGSEQGGQNGKGLTYANALATVMNQLSLTMFT